jgi:hypothetical protein
MSKKKRSNKRPRSLYGGGDGALTPMPPATEEMQMLERQQLLASLENKLNAQQKRINDHERHFLILKQENAELRKLVANVRLAYLQNLAPRPGPAEKK